MKKLAISAAALLTIAGTALGMSGATAATTTTIVPRSGQTPVARPASIVLAQADGNDYLTGLKWSAWAPSYAKAVGVEHTNDCKPNCAAGTFHTKTVNVLLDKVVTGQFRTVTVINSQNVWAHN